MPIISTIGRRSFRTRLLIGTIYGLLLVGATTMVYPFMLMIAGSSKSRIDTPEAKMIPTFLSDDEALYRKHLEGFFNENIEHMRITYGSTDSSFAIVEMPTQTEGLLVEHWRDFLSENDLSRYSYNVGYFFARQRITPKTTRQFKNEVSKKYGGDIDTLNAALETEFVSWYSFSVKPSLYVQRLFTPGFGKLDQLISDFCERQPIENRYYAMAEGGYKVGYLQAQFSRDIAIFNEAYGTNYASYDEVFLDRRVPAQDEKTDQEIQGWEDYVRNILNVLWVRVEPEAIDSYRAFLRKKYFGEIANLNKVYESSYVSFDQMELPGDQPYTGFLLSDWSAFIQGWSDPETGKVISVPVEYLYVDSVEFRFRDALKALYGTIEKVNVALGTQYHDWIEIYPPQKEFHYQDFVQHTGSLRWEFLTRNFITVVDYIVLKGWGVFNTVVYCTLAVLASLVVNPLAAYGLSRYKPPSAYKMLMIMMLTMAFPPMVLTIPTFLMLRDMGLLNTYWALVLPGLASGYWIFLLKGFFDSLPQELYESASLDGASELRIFLQITMSLSKPVLAVIALGAFTNAYANFMMALLICQDQDMWTLMPWLFQLQQQSGQGVIYASLLIAAIPTFLIFAFCQNVIMRGIVVPVEK